jgi:hypothetical protein
LTAGADLATQVNQTFAVTENKLLCLGAAMRGNGTTAGILRLWDNTHGAEITVWKNLVIHDNTQANYCIIVKAYLVPEGCVSVKMLFLCSQTNGHITYADEIYLTMG